MSSRNSICAYCCAEDTIILDFIIRREGVKPLYFPACKACAVAIFAAYDKHDSTPNWPTPEEYKGR